jgi:hypothetical protein
LELAVVSDNDAVMNSSELLWMMARSRGNGRGIERSVMD